jgi:hypothetical protein
MSTYTETRTEARKRRAAFAGEVDFTMMYVAHNAFNRDLARLIIAADAGKALSPATIATCKGASEYLPWVLEGAGEPVQAKVLHMLLAPARLLYRRMWAPNYSKSVRLG